MDKINKNIDDKIVAINISVKTVTTLSSYFMGLLRSRVTYVGDWETGDLREIHVVRPASGPKLPQRNRVKKITQFRIQT